MLHIYGEEKKRLNFKFVFFVRALSMCHFSSSSHLHQLLLFIYFCAFLCLLKIVHIVLIQVWLILESWPLCLLCMSEAAAAFLPHQPQWQAFFALPHYPSFFTFHFCLYPFSLVFNLVFLILFYILLFSSRLCLCLVPVFPLTPPPPSLTRPVCKMIAAVELLPTPGALMKAILRWM